MIKTAANIVKGVLTRKRAYHSKFKQIRWVQEKLLKHQEDKQVKKLAIDDLSIFYKRPYELLHSYREIFEREIYKFKSHPEAKVIIDCGSNIGLSVLYFNKLYPDAAVYAFEPDENNFTLLSRNIEHNKIKNVVVQQAAVWTQDGAISFNANESEASHISEVAFDSKVPCIRLKSFLQKFKSIDFLKIDIEGAEVPVVRDCADCLGNVQNMFLEYHGKVDDTEKLAELLVIVKAAGFKTYIRNAADIINWPFVDKHSQTLYDVQLNLFCYR